MASKMKPMKGAMKGKMPDQSTTKAGMTPKAMGKKMKSSKPKKG